MTRIPPRASPKAPPVVVGDGAPTLHAKQAVLAKQATKAANESLPPRERVAGDEPPVAALSPDEAGRRFGALTSDLARAACLETTRYALRKLADRGLVDDDALAALEADPRTRAAAARAAGEPVEALVAELGALLERHGVARSAVEPALLDELTVFRYGERHDVGFAVAPVDLAPVTADGSVAPERGYSAGVEGIRLDGEHSLGDVQRYVRDRVGGFVLDDLVAERRTIEFHAGSAERCLASLKARGFTQVVEVNGPKSKFHNRLFLAQHPATGEVRWAMGEIYGRDRLAHMQKLVGLGEVPGPAGPRFVSSSQVRVFADPLVHPEDIYRRYSRALLASGSVPPDVVIGFKSGLLSELGRRALAGRKLERLKAELGDDVAAALRARAARGGEAGRKLAAALDSCAERLGVLARDAAAVFRFSSRVDDLAAVERALVEAARDPAVAALLDGLAGERGFLVDVNGRVAEQVAPDTFVDQSLITWLDDEGRQRSLLVTRNPYGDLAHHLGRVLVDNGVENIFVVGTAGGLEHGGEVGDLHAPARLVGAGGEEIAFENRAVELLLPRARAKELGGRVKVGTTLAEVDSPLDETRAEVQRMKSAGYQLVEMELADLVRAVKERGPAVTGMYIVSDLPGTEHTLESHSGAHMQAALGLVADALIEQLGMRDVKLVGEAVTKSAPGFEGARVLADRVLGARGLVGDDYTCLRHTLARYLYNGLTDAQVASLVVDEKRDPLKAQQLAPRWAAKITRELAAPFTNDQLIARLRELGAKLGDAVRAIDDAGAAPGSYRLHVLGSIVKGRAGQGSDVDVLIETGDKALAERVFRGPYGYAGAPADSPVVIGGYEYAMQRGNHYGPVVDVGEARSLLESPDLLVDLWAEAVRAQGLSVTKDAKSGAVRVELDAGAAPVVERETEHVAERVLEYEKAYRDWMNSDFVLRHLEHAAALGDVVHLPFDRLVARGEALIAARLGAALDKGELIAFLRSPDGAAKLATPRGKAFLDAAGAADGDAVCDALATRGPGALPLAILVDGEVASALMRISDPLDALAVDLAAAERARKEKERLGQAPAEPFAFFAGDVTRAAGRAVEKKAAGPTATRIASLVKSKPPSSPAGSFFDSHVARGSGTRDLGAVRVVYGKDGVGRVDVDALVERDPIAREILAFCRARGVPVGFWGGAARDLLRGRPRDATSDVDLVFDSRAPNARAFKKQLIAHLKERFDALPTIDFSVDMNPAVSMRGPYRGLTLEKLAVLDDGRVLDFTGRGLDDLAAGLLRYNPTNPRSGEPIEPPGVGSLFRMMGARLQNESFAFDDDTAALMTRVLRAFYAPESASVREMRALFSSVAGLEKRARYDYLEELRARHGGEAPGEAVLDVEKTLRKIVKGGVASDPRRYLEELERSGLAALIGSIGMGETLAPLREAAADAAR